MPFRVMIAGVPVECDTIEDAVALAQRAGGDTTSGPKSARAADREMSIGNSRWTEARGRDFFGHLKGNQRKLVDELLDHPEGRMDEQLLSALGLRDGRQLAGVFTGLWKNAKKVGADPNDVYQGKSLTIADRKASEYLLTDSFRRVAEKVRPSAKK